MADVLVVELAALAPDHERFDAKTTVLIESVEHHISEEEEDNWCPKGTRTPRAPEAPGDRCAPARAEVRRSDNAQPSALEKAIDAVIH